MARLGSFGSFVAFDAVRKDHDAARHIPVHVAYDLHPEKRETREGCRVCAAIQVVERDAAQSAATLATIKVERDDLRRHLRDRDAHIRNLEEMLRPHLRDGTNEAATEAMF